MLDEPLGALDRPWHARLLREIGELLERTQLPALYVTHDHEEAFALADRIVMMRRGRWCRPAFPPTCGGTRPTSGPPHSSASAPQSTARSVPTGSPRRGGRSPSRGKRGRAVRVMVPPDAVTIDGAGPIAGRVVRSAFAGDRAELTVDAGGAALRVRVPDRAAPRWAPRFG